MREEYNKIAEMEARRDRRKNWARDRGFQSIKNYSLINQKRSRSRSCLMISRVNSIHILSTNTIKFKRTQISIQRPNRRPQEQRILVLITLIISATVLLYFINDAHAQAVQDSPSREPKTQPITSDTNTLTTSASTTASSCFGGLQVFEKISMSSFENPTSSSNAAGGFFNGVLIQQDDQALTSECLNICRSQSNCLSFVIDYNKFECKSYATTQQELQQELESKFQASRNLNESAMINAGRSLNTNNSTDYLQDQPQASASTMQASHLLPSASSNYFEKICLDGIANRNHYSDICGQGRLWAIERVVDSFLDGYVEKEMTNVNNKDECSKLCIFESQFVCRSADYDQRSRLCRLSKEDRRTQPQAMRSLSGSNRHYLENQCATPGPSTCVYETKKNLGIISMDALKFAQSEQDCQMKCNQETSFNCRSYSFHQQQCFLSGDDSSSLNSNLIKMPQRVGWQFGEKKCLVELCSKGVFSYEKITGFTLRSALATPIDLMMMPSGSSISFAVSDLSSSESSQTNSDQTFPILNPRDSIGASPSVNLSLITMLANSGQSEIDPMLGLASTPRQRRSGSSNLAITQQCRNSCDLGYLNCPAFTVDYKNNRCQRLDRNSQGRHHELVPREGFSYYEKICLRVPEIMSMCQDKFWIFERVIGYELAPHLYDKSLKFVQSRRDCEEYCLEEKQFQCRSALYNDETSDCKLSSYDRRLANQVGGYYRNFNARISYLENQCIRDQTVDRKRLQCHYEQARDQSSYPTFTERIEMVPMMPNPGNTRTAGVVEISRSASMMHQENITNMTSFGVSYCKQLCNSNENFECRSFGYYSSTAQCFLSGDDFTSAGDSAASSSTGFTYFEKKCKLQSANESVVIVNPDYQDHRQNHDRPGLEPMNPYFQPPRRNQSSQIDQAGQPPPSINMDSVTTTTTDNYPMHHPTYSGTHPDGANQTDGSTISPSSGPDQYKCGQAHTFVYQRISGFEPIGGLLTLLIRDNNQPGIVSDCAELCKKAYECRAFVIDYNSNQCYAMLENSSVGMLSLRQTIGKDYFEGFCVPEHLLLGGNHCQNKTWIIDKIVDQAVVGVQHQKLIPDSDRVQCRQACIEERMFYCKSAMFDGSNGDCKLFSIDRESVPQMRLLFTRGVDFFENQCQIVSNSCPYDAIERDMTMVTTTKSTQARSTFECEQACNSEVSFNCRSYTYVDQNPSLPNLCLLSSDSRSTSQRGSVKEQARTLYAERNCYFRRPRYPGGNQPTESADAGQPTTELIPNQDPYQVSPHSNKPQGSLTPVDPYSNTGPHESGGLSDTTVGPAPGQACEPHQYTFERTFGYDYRLAQKERAPIPPTVAIAIGCQQECLKRDRCQSFVVEYSFPYQSCFLMETQVGANKKLLVKAGNSAYFEKICIPRTGVDTDQTSGSQVLPPSHSPLHETIKQYDALPLYSSNNDRISPGYSSEPWVKPPSNNQLPYYMQLQQLVQNYPSRSCAKLWAFERFVNHNFTVQSERTFDKILTRNQCETLCLNEASFSCRAGTYDYYNKICRLFKNTRRTIMSQFVDMESGMLNPESVESKPEVTAGTAHIIGGGTGEVESLVSSSSNQVANSNDLNPPIKRQADARQLIIQTAEPTSNQRNIDYFENTCVPEPSSCQYRQMYDMFSPYIDKISHAVSLSDCQRQCDLERLFSCKSLNYDPATKNCMLINEDLISLSRGSKQSQALISRRGSVYSEKGNCEMINVQCTSQEMLVSINFDTPFRGRIMAKGNPDQCFMLGDGQTAVHFPIVFGPKCNSRQEGHNTFTNEIVIQQHPVIMTESDKTVRVMCAFEAPDQTITLKNPTSRDNKTGIDVGTPESGRTRNDKQQFSSVVSNKAPPPSVLLRILDNYGRDASMTNLGDDLVLKIQMQMDGRNSALSIFARNLVARSSNGESLLLIDNEGCPVDSNVFPALELDPRDGKSLSTSFKAFRFPSSGLVNFEVQIKFCPEKCQPVECRRGLHSKSYGRRKRRDVNEETPGRTTVFQSVESSLNRIEPPSTLMKPGKAFQYVREIMLPKTETITSENTTSMNITESQPTVGESLETDQKANENGVSQDGNQGIGEQEISTTETASMDQGRQSLGNQPERPSTMDGNENGDSVMSVSDSKPPNINKMTNVHLPFNPVAPYGRFPLHNMGFERPSLYIDTSQTSDRVSPSGWSSNNLGNLIPLKNIPTTDQDSEPQADNVQNSLEPTQSIGSINQEPTSGTSNSGKDVPLKFSILVGEKQPPLTNGWTPTGPPMLVMNSTDVDLDHIVIPGKDGQLDQAATSDSRDHISSNANNHPTRGFGAKSSNTEPQSFYEQSLDALSSSNSVTEDRINLNQDRTRLGDFSDGMRKLTTRSNGLQTSETAASHDCHVESSRGKLWTIIWTGTFVIVINVCLVLLSLILYFRRVHSSQNHNIVFGTPDISTESSRIRHRWPSVLLKSKNDLGTSLSTHEHFFCKLNSKTNTPSSISTGNDYNNWTSTSSSHSTISSMASPLPVSNIKINQTRLQRYPFDFQPSRYNLGLSCKNVDLNEARPFEGSTNHGYSSKTDD